MSGWFRKRIRVLCAALTVVTVGLWLTAVCAAAAPTCESPCAKHHTAADLALPCQQAIAPCESLSLDTPTVAKVDFSVVPVVLGTEPARMTAPDIAPAPPTDWASVRPPSTPLYLKYLALLN